jgi:hypothetical protein
MAMYGVDQDDRLVQGWSTPGALVFHGGNGKFEILPQGSDCPGWVSGVMDFSSNNVCNGATILLTDSRYAQFSAYNKNPAIYRCSSDPSVVPQPNGKRIRRVRSYSLNGVLGLRPIFADRKIFNGQQVPPMKKLSDITNPPPDRQFAFLDENPNSILDTDFWVDGLFGLDILDSIPASYHNGSGCLSFMDGHVEAHRWLDPKTKMPLNPKWICNDLLLHGTLTQSSDALWLHARSAFPAASW